MYYVYILYSRAKKVLYIGFTECLEERVQQHRQGKSQFTSRASDWTLVYYEVFVNKKDARAEERFLKSGKGRERVRFLLANTLECLKKEVVGNR